MRIVCYFFPPGAYNLGGGHWYYHLADELQRHDHQVTAVNPLDRGTGLSRAHYDEFVVSTIAREHEREPISLFFASVRDHEMSAGAVARIADLGIRTVNLSWDDTLMSHRVKNIASAFDLCWVIEPLAVDVMRRHGARVLHQPAATNPYLFHPEQVAETVDVSFCGQRYGSRVHYVEELFRQGIPVEVYGVGWKSAHEGGNPGGQQRRLSLIPAIKHVAGSLTHSHGRTWARAALLRRLRPHRTASELLAKINRHVHPPLPFAEMVRLYSRSKLTLGFNEHGHTYLLKEPLVIIRGRDLEALASGACHLMYRVPAIQALFEEDKEVLLYSSAEELADKVRFYLDPRRDSARAEIRRRARARMLQEHTWAHRFNRLFKELDLAA